MTSGSGLAFHPTQPLLAAALHNGSVQLWNYRMGVLVDRFEEHEGKLISFNRGTLHAHRRTIGPVRGVAIHPTRPLLATGGDDYKIRVWGTCSRLGVGRDTPRLTHMQTSALRTDDASSLCMVTWIMFELFSSIMRCPGSYVHLCPSGSDRLTVVP